MRFLLFIIIGLHISAYARIVETKTLDPLAELLPTLDSSDVVLFDYEGTLVMPNDAVLFPCGKKCLTGLIKFRAPHLKAAEIKELISILLVQRKLHLVDENSITLIKSLQEQSVLTFCLTALRTGSFGCIPKTEVWRKDELKSLGIDFKRAFPETSYLKFDHYQQLAHPPVLVEGVFCSGSVLKGEALAHFFQKMEMKPKRVIFVDNSKAHHDSVQKWMDRLNIEYLGFLYLAAKEQAKDVDEKIALFQIDYLIKNKKWLSDKQAAKMLELGE